IYSDLMTPMMVRPGLGMRLEDDRADPGLFSAVTSEIKCCRTSCGRGFKHDFSERLCSHKLYAVGSPIYRFCHCQLHYWFDYLRTFDQDAQRNQLLTKLVLLYAMEDTCPL